MPVTSHLSLYLMAAIDGILVYALIHHLMIGRRASHRTLHSLFAVVCLLTLLLSVAHMRTISSLTTQVYLERLKVEHIFALLLVYNLSVFVLYYAGRLRHWFIIGFGGLFAILVMVDVALPYTVQYKQFFGIVREILPWGQTITTARGQPGVTTAITTAIVLVSFGYAFWALLRAYCASKDRSRLWMLIAFGIVIAGTIESILVRLGLFHGALLAPYDTLGMVVVMSLLYVSESQQELATAQSNFKALFEGSPTAMASFAPDTGRIIEANPAAIGLAGYTREDFLHRKVTEFGLALSPDDETSFPLLLKQLQNGVMPTSYYEGRLVRRDGEERLLDLYFSVIRNALGHVVRIIANAIDVTETRLAHQAMVRESEKNQVLMRSSSDGIHIVNEKGHLVEGSDSFFRMLGYERDELLGCHIIEWDDRLTFSAIRENLQKLVQANSYIVFETRHKRKDGAIFPVEIAAVPITLEGKRYIYNASRDITQRHLALRALKESETQFQTLFSTSPVGIAFCRRGHLIRTNRAYAVLHGYPPDTDLTGLPLSRFFADAGKQTLQRFKKHQDRGLEEAFSTETLGLKRNGATFPVLMSLRSVEMAEGEVTFCYVIDFSELKAREEQIQELAFYDQLTKLPNRHLMIDRLTLALSNAERSKHYGAVLLIDLDNFKAINNTLGHDHGDDVLKRLSARLLKLLRKGDTLARLGGDEFLVILESLSDIEHEAIYEAEATAQKLLHALEERFDLSGKEYRCTGCIGITLFNNAELSIDERIKQADIAMYQAKSTSRSSMQFFDPRMQDSVNRRAKDEADLYQAIEQKQFELHYQVQVDSACVPTGAEALIRWRHPERGMIAPCQFIPLAEETGQILAIGEWVINAACAQMRLWQAELQTRHLTLSFNISSLQFQQRDFVTLIRKAIQRHAAPPELLKIELTESVLLDNADHAIAIMQELRELGIRFSLDDFGTGYSSLQYLKRLPLDQLKIDKSFIHDITEDLGDLSIVQTIAAMAGKLGFEVIAEGVETQKQYQLLASIGQFSYQGYLFGRPGPAENLFGTTPPDGQAPDILKRI